MSFARRSNAEVESQRSAEKALTAGDPPSGEYRHAPSSQHGPFQRLHEPSRPAVRGDRWTSQKPFSIARIEEA